MFKKIGVLVSIILLSACGTIADVVVKTAKVIADPSIKVGENEDQPSKISLSMNASDDLNINLYSEGLDSSKATPLAFKVVQLKDDSLFRGVGFEALADNLKKALGSTYINHDDYEIDPGTFKFVDFEEVSKKTKFIAVIGAYNNFEEATWKGLTKIKPVGNEYSILLQFSANDLEVKKEGESKDEQMKIKKQPKKIDLKEADSKEIDGKEVNVKEVENKEGESKGIEGKGVDGSGTDSWQVGKNSGVHFYDIEDEIMTTEAYK